jgi:hypothetical protein
MSRELRTTLAIIAVVLLLGAPLIFADAPTPSTSSYLALIFQNTPPPPIEILVIQFSEMPPLYRILESREVTNAEAATGYHDPAAAASAFIAQGRETSWYAFYNSTLVDPGDAFDLSSQVYRYQTPTGAAQGLAYTGDEQQFDHPEFQPVTVTIPCCPNTIALHRTISIPDGATFECYLMISQVGRYVTATQMTALLGTLPLSQALSYHQRGINHLTTIPQATQASK